MSPGTKPLDFRGVCTTVVKAPLAVLVIPRGQLLGRPDIRRIRRPRGGGHWWGLVSHHSSPLLPLLYGHPVALSSSERK